eukprot:TRINITY_DN7496_c0_g1_i2.p1 TRINITY_DN7496_c0_g1~~TRINITY_DN7496_c0_g1_i2.p1  ORF type:complete len:253 (-),score=53.85 TRINITY_DN7496_c0_g1_i2:13-771(-)
MNLSEQDVSELLDGVAENSLTITEQNYPLLISKRPDYLDELHRIDFYKIPIEIFEFAETSQEAFDLVKNVFEMRGFPITLEMSSHMYRNNKEIFEVSTEVVSLLNIQRKDVKVEFGEFWVGREMGCSFSVSIDMGDVVRVDYKVIQMEFRYKEIVEISYKGETGFLCQQFIDYGGFYVFDDGSVMNGAVLRDLVQDFCADDEQKRELLKLVTLGFKNIRAREMLMKVNYNDIPEDPNEMLCFHQAEAENYPQ